MTDATIAAMLDAWREILCAARAEGKRVEFEERTARGGVVYLMCKVSVREEAPAEGPSGTNAASG